MPTRKRWLVQVLLALAIVPNANFVPAVYSQQTDRNQTQDRPSDVIRTTTELVQTEVMVFDRQGRFVNGLRPEQFELLLNGTKQPISFFEKITAGSQTEAAQLAAARIKPGKEKAGTEPPKTGTVGSEARGRVLFFFFDDFHLSAASLNRARKALLRFVDDEMNPNDQVAIVSTSGQVGFLQQLTSHPAVLHAAIARLNFKQTSEAYTGKTQISEFMATQIADYNNRELFAYLMDSTKLEQQMGAGSRHGDHQLAAAYSAGPVVRNRVQQINAQARMTTADTLNVLKGLMASSAALPGRKVVFFLSDGLLINERKAGALELLEKVTEEARRSGVVVYTMDLRGTFFNMGAGIDVSNNALADFTSRMSGLPYAELAATQEPLKLIAEQTGGRALLNSNAIGDDISQAISETSEYYLLAWRPESPEQRQRKQRLQVTVRDRPDLRVRLRTNVYQAPAQVVAKANQNEPAKEVSASLPASASPSASQPPLAESELVRTLGSLYPRKGLPVSLAVGFVNASDAGLVLKLSMQIDRAALDFDPQAKTQQSEVDVMGAAVDDRGQVASFKHVLTVPRETPRAEPTVVWHQQLRVKPGLYQVRVALRERRSGQTGSAMQWIDLPETTAAQFGLSSLFLGERRGEASEGSSGSPASTGPQAISVDVDHRFSRGSALRFQTYVYNAARGEKGPEVSIETQVLRNRQPIMAVVPVKVPLTNDAARLPYWSEIALKDLLPGHYMLLVIATDHIANRTAAQRVNFVVE